MVCSYWSWRFFHSLCSLLAALFLCWCVSRLSTMPTRYPCAVCCSPVRVNQPGVQCEACLRWHHCKCLGITSVEYVSLQASSDGWCCPNCWKLPFADCSSLSSLPGSVSSFASTSSMAASPSKHPSCQFVKHPLLFSFYSTNCRSLLKQIDDLRLLASSS